MVQYRWLQKAAPIAPLLSAADLSSWGGEAGVLEQVFKLIPQQAGYAVEFGQRSLATGTVGEVVRKRGWSALYMDVETPTLLESVWVEGGGTITLARERITPSNINALFERHDVPTDLDCLVIDIDGLDLWVWQALEPKYRPSLVIVEFNAHVPFGIEATIHCNEAWQYHSTKDYGASFSALCALAERKGFRLIHVHGPWNLYFLRSDIEWPSNWAMKHPLNENDLALLTSAVDFYESFCAGKRPSWIDAPAPDVSQRPWEILVAPQPSKEIDIEGLVLDVLADKYDVTWYQQRKVVEEKVSPLYPLLQRSGFETLVDIGANVGMISVFARQACPGMRIVAVEADPRLVQLLRTNFSRHGIENAIVINAIVGAEEQPQSFFSLNPNSTLDNRVVLDRWNQISIPMVNMGKRLTALHPPVGRTFLKIDTQGYELHVLNGLQSYLMSSDDWLLKMEFAPDWLRSQGTEPKDVLAHLQQDYEFAEYPERIPYGTASLDELFAHPIQPDCHENFITYVTSLNRKGLGWVDLIVRRKMAETAVRI